MKTTNTELLKKPKWIITYEGNLRLWIGLAQQTSIKTIRAENVIWFFGGHASHFTTTAETWHIGQEFKFEIITEEQAKKEIFMLKTGIQ